jgi:sulfatase maturation enzyme AslB (radical SAM superfamily)
MSTDPAFLERIESLFFGRDFRAAEDKEIHRHGTSNIKFGRGAVLTVDLTNRCNMMCNPCFMDANQVGYVHEPTFEDTKAILDRAVSFKPKRQVIILFSGGEPTLSPYYLEAVSTRRRSASIGFWLQQMEFDSPKTLNSAKQQRLRGSMVSICSSTE